MMGKIVRYLKALYRKLFKPEMSGLGYVGNLFMNRGQDSQKGLYTPWVIIGKYGAQIVTPINIETLVGYYNDIFKKLRNLAARGVEGIYDIEGGLKAIVYRVR